MANANLKNAKKQKNDEFYTQYQDIQKEVNAYLEYDNNVLEEKQFYFLVMTQSGVILQSFLLRILKTLELKN